MGMIVDGQWTDEDRIIANTRYVREASVFGEPLGAGRLAQLQAEPERFHLIASPSCQWSHRAVIARLLKGWSGRIPLTLAHGPRVEGYAVNGGYAWTVPGSGRSIRHLHQLYTISHPDYTGRATVPVLWDRREQRIVSNASARIFEALDQSVPSSAGPAFHLGSARPDQEIKSLMDRIHAGLSNGVYRAGFAESQAAYDEAVTDVFETLDLLENRLGQRRYLGGSAVRVADWFLFTTLVRFDCVYHVLHRCCRRRLVDYPQLWAYARDLYSWRGIDSTVDFEAIRSASYANDTAANPFGIVAVAPDADWRRPHGREMFGPARVLLENGKTLHVDPETFGCETGI